MGGRILGTTTRLCIAGIIIGIVFMIQPFFFPLFRYGFYILLLSTIVYTVVARFPSRPGAEAGGDMVEELPVSIGNLENMSK
jgi:hypothetical protein